MLPGGLLFKTASHTLIFSINALSSCSTCDSNVSELWQQTPQLMSKCITIYSMFFVVIKDERPDGKQWRLWNLKHKSLYRMMLFIHDDHHHLLCIILGEERDISRVNRQMSIDTFPINVLPFQWVASHTAECLECTDSVLGDMTSENTTHQI